MITDSGDTLWLDMFRKPPAQILLSAATKESFEKGPSSVAPRRQLGAVCRNWLFATWLYK
jgi:hypothetical protein